MALLKITFAFSVLAASLKYVRAVSMDDRTKINEEIMPSISICSKEFEFSNADVQTAKEAGTTVKLDPCFLGCVFKRSKVINDKGLFDTDKGADMIRKYLSEEIDQKKALDIISTCNKVNEQDVTDGDKGCERASLLFQCLIPHKGLTASTDNRKKIKTAVFPHVVEGNADFGVSEDEIKKREPLSLGSTDPCFMGCTFKKFKLIDDQGLIDVDKAGELALKYFSDDVYQKRALDIISTCKEVNERDVTDGENMQLKEPDF